MLAPVLERQPADEVRQPDVCRRLQLRVLVQEVVDLPGLVADPEVVVLLARDVEEEHEVRDEDLVHPADRLEGVQVVLGRLALDVAGLVREQRARRVDPLAFGLEHRRDRMLREPVDLEVGMELAQLLRDCDVPPCVPEPDRRRDVERAPPAAERPRPRLHLRRRRRDLVGEVLEQAVHLHRVARRRHVARALERDERPARELRDRERALARLAVVQLAVDDEHRAADACDEFACLLRAGEGRRRLLVGKDERLHASVEPPADAVLDLLRRVRLGELLREEELEEPTEVAPPVVDVPLGPALVGVERLGGRIATVVRMSRRQPRDGGRDRRYAERERGSVAASMSA